MDFATLAQQIVLALAPLSPLLGGVSAGIGASIVNKLGEDIYNQSKEQGKQLYQTVKVRVEEEKAIDNGKASKALQNFIEDPVDYGDIFRKKLESLLQADPAFAGALERMLQQNTALRQLILLEENAIARGNKQSNTLGIGDQRMEIGKWATAENNEQNISKSS